MSSGETIAAPATPAGESALALIRASGPLAPALAAAALGRAKDSPPPPRQATFGDYYVLSGEIIDQIVLTRYAAPASYTGDDLVEIACHGNPLIVRRILDDLVARGCRLAEPGEFTRAAFLNGKLDLSQAEAVADLIRARSDGALRAARRQLDGELGRRVREFSEKLLEIQAGIEAYIDFPEEDLPPEDSRGPRAGLAAISAGLEKLLATARYGVLLRDGASLVIAGPPNAGKSSLLNALLGRPRAIVSPLPGTTRDFIEERFLAGPYSIQITDTAGLSADSTDPVEQEGMVRSLEKIATADFLLLVIDSTLNPPTLPQAVINMLRPNQTMVVENKTDLSDSKNRQVFLSQCRHLRLSVKTGEGIEQLKNELVRMIEDSYSISTEDLILTSARQVEALTRARDALAAALTKYDSKAPVELLASDLRQGLEALGEVLGLSFEDGASRIDNEAMLDRLFAKFCIGK